MQSRGLEIVVGMFVCLGIAAIFILTLRVSNLADVSTGESYQVSAQFSNIGGLRAGAQVSLAGVRIGRVADIAVDQQTYEAKVSMNIDKQYKIPEDSDASILTAGLLGEQYIGVGPGASDDGPVRTPLLGPHPGGSHTGRRHVARRGGWRAGRASEHRVDQGLDWHPRGKRGYLAKREEREKRGGLPS